MSKTKTQSFGAWLYHHRKARGLTQAGLGAKVELTSQQISNYERGHSESKTGRPMQPSLELIDALARALRLPVDEARAAAGYAPLHASPTPGLDQIAPFWVELPMEVQQDLLAQIKALHARRRSAPALDPDQPEWDTQKHNTPDDN